MASQGVLLLNTILTAELGKSLSHKDIGWEKLTSEIIREVSLDNSPKVFMLWGKNAKTLNNEITNPTHLILENSHPSPFSVNYGSNCFNGSNCFKLANEFLISKNIEPIRWV